MNEKPSLKKILEEIYPLHRTLASEGTDQALEIVGKYMPDASNYQFESYAPGTKAWTWVVPERYVVKEAYLETEDGERIVDFADNPLHLLSYSLPMDEILSWEQIEKHLHFSEKFPDAIPWQFQYYNRTWGFCLSKNTFDQLPRDKKYHVVIDVAFDDRPEPGFKVTSAVIHPEGGSNPEAGEILINAHICHPMQANDDAAGVVTAIGVAQRLAKNPLPPGSMSVRFLFCPETIGSIAYLSQNEDLIGNFKAGIFIEMTGNKNSLILQHSLQADHLIDQVAESVLEKSGKDFREGEFAQVIANDERVINGPGVNVPCISISRWPYEEYHTTEDNPSIIEEEMLQEAVEMIENTVRIFASNYRPMRKFRGPVFLSGYDLWVDWRDNWDLNRAIEKIMMRFEGDLSVFEIARELGLNYWHTREYVEKFREKGFVDPLPIQSEARKK